MLQAARDKLKGRLLLFSLQFCKEMIMYLCSYNKCSYYNSIKKISSEFSKGRQTVIKLLFGCISITQEEKIEKIGKVATSFPGHPQPKTFVNKINFITAIFS